MNARFLSGSICLLIVIFLMLEGAHAATAPSKNGVSNRPRVGIDTSFGDAVRDAFVELKAKRYEVAISRYSALLRMNPDDRNASFIYLYRGLCYREMGDFAAAIADYSAAIRCDPKIKNAHYYRGSLYSRMGNFSGALSDLNEAVRQDPTSTPEYQSRARVYEELGNLNLARSDYERVIRVPPKDGGDYALRAKAFEAIGNYSAAAADFSRALRMSSRDHYVLNSAAWFKATCPESSFRSGREAIQKSTKACELTKWRDLNAIDTLAAAYAEIGHFDQAMKYGAQALSKSGLLTRSEKEIREHLRLYQEHKPVREKSKFQKEKA